MHKHAQVKFHKWNMHVQPETWSHNNIIGTPEPCCAPFYIVIAPSPTSNSLGYFCLILYLNKWNHAIGTLLSLASFYSSVIVRFIQMVVDGSFSWLCRVP